MFDQYTALVVDDSHTVLRIVSTILKDQLQFKQVIEAASPAEAKELIDAGAKVDIILSGWEFPHTTGLNFLHDIRDDIRTTAAPFFMMTTHEDDKSLVQIFKAGATDYLIKPFAANDLMEKIRRTMRPQEKRNAPRFALAHDIPVSMEFSEGIKYPGTLIDVSQGGCQVDTVPFKNSIVCVYDEAQINIHAGDEHVHLKGSLLRIQNNRSSGPKGSRTKVAFQFVDIDARNMQELIKLIKTVSGDVPDQIG